MIKKLLFGISCFGLTALYGQNAADLPYSYGFETSDLDGWTIINAGSGNNWAVTQASSQTPDPSEGSNYMMYYFHENAANSYLFTKGIKMKAGQPVKLSFDYMGTDAWFPEKMEVLIGTAPSVEAQTTRLWMNEDIVNYPYTTAFLDFNVPADGIYYVSFRAFSDPDQFYLSLDNVRFNIPFAATQDQDKTKLSVYPNPTKDFLRIDSDTKITSIGIFDISGKIIKKQFSDSKQVSLDVSELSKGTYMLRIGDDKGAKMHKFIKE